MLYKNTKLTI